MPFLVSQPAICSGDHCWPSLQATNQRRRGLSANRQDCGLRAASQAASSACAARYRSRPPCRATSRLIVEVGRPRLSAIWRNDWPEARHRDISSRSIKLSDRADRRRSLGAIPPCAARTPKIEPGFLSKKRAMSLSDWPPFHRRHRSRFWARDMPGRPILAISFAPISATVDHVALTG